MVKKIAIVGHFGGPEKFTDGQTVKTLTLYNELKKYFDNIYIVDTYYKNKNPLKLIYQLIVSLICTKHIFILLSGNGMRFFFPIFSFSASYFHKNIYHDVIGGNLSNYIDSNKKYLKYLNTFRYNFVETNLMKHELYLRGINNLVVIPNFRNMKSVSIQNWKHKKNIFEFCTFSRVTKEKGIIEAIEAIEQFNSIHNNYKCTLDIYGSISEEFLEEFKIKLALSSNNVRYKGEVPYSKATDTISSYYGLLFPTRWKGEGSAGTILESYFAGVPVIATDWKFNKEMISNFQTGVLYPCYTINTLLEGIEWLVAHKNEITDLKKNCIEASKYYLPEEHIKHIIKLMGE